MNHRCLHPCPGCIIIKPNTPVKCRVQLIPNKTKEQCICCNGDDCLTASWNQAGTIPQWKGATDDQSKCKVCDITKGIVPRLDGKNGCKACMGCMMADRVSGMCISCPVDPVTGKALVPNEKRTQCVSCPVGKRPDPLRRCQNGKPWCKKVVCKVGQYLAANLMDCCWQDEEWKEWQTGKK